MTLMGDSTSSSLVVARGYYVDGYVGARSEVGVFCFVDNEYCSARANVADTKIAAFYDVGEFASEASCTSSERSLALRQA